MARARKGRDRGAAVAGGKGLVVQREETGCNNNKS